MKKNSYIKILLALMLVFGSLVGCQPTKQKSGTISTPKQTNTSQASRNLSIDAAFNNFKDAQKNFREKLKAVENDKKSQAAIKSDNVNQSLKEMQTAIKDFRTKKLPKIDLENKESVTTILNDIDTNLTEISEKVIDPLKDGLNNASVRQVQESLNLDIRERDKGIFGSKTREGIEKFLNSQQNALGTKINELNQIVKTEASTSVNPELKPLSDKIKKLEQENKFLKPTFYLPLVIALLSLLVSIISLLKKTKPKRRQVANTSQQNLDKTSINKDVNVALYPDLQQIYQQIYPQLYNQLSGELNQEISSLDQKKIDKMIEQKIQAFLSQKRIEETQTRTQTLQDPQPTRNQPPVVSPPQVDNFSISNWIDTYNHNPSSLSRKVTEVSETEDSLDSRQIGSSQAVILATKHRGNYWILADGGVDYLVPSQSLRINQHNYKTVEALFECRNYNPDCSSDFKLLKPAVVYPLSSGQTWQLQEPGILKF